MAANGERIPNMGEVTLDMETLGVPVKSTFQVSKISKPLWSVGKICDQGYEVKFSKDRATITNVTTGRQIEGFVRDQGLYVAKKMRLRNPEATKPFPRQA